MKKYLCLMIFCPLLLVSLLTLSAGAAEKWSGPQKPPLRSVVLKADTAAPAHLPFQAMATAFPLRSSVSRPALVMVQEINRQWWETLLKGFLEGDSEFAAAAYDRSRAITPDMAAVKVVYWMNPVEFLTLYFRFGSDWLQERNHYFKTGISGRNGDGGNFNAGAGVRFGINKYMALDLDAGYTVSSSRDNKPGRDDSWAATAALVFYFD